MTSVLSPEPPDGMALCPYCAISLPFDFAVHFETGELVKCYPAIWPHYRGCPFDDDFECPF
jgi:hypothetical protein